MPFKESKQVPGLIIHYGKWTRADEDAFYDRVNFSDWKGSHGIIPHVSSPQEPEPPPLQEGKPLPP